MAKTAGDDRLSAIMESKHEEITREIVAVLKRYDIEINRTNVAWQWNCTLDGAPVPCTMFTWLLWALDNPKGP